MSLATSRCLEMSPASVAPVAARLEKKRTPKFLQVSSRHSDKLAPSGADIRAPDTAPMPRSCDDLGTPPLSVQMTPVPAQIMHLSASRPFAFHGSKARHSAFHREDTSARPLIPGDERISSPSMWVRRGYRPEARRGTQATPRRFATQDETIFETHNRDDSFGGTVLHRGEVTPARPSEGEFTAPRIRKPKVSHSLWTGPASLGPRPWLAGQRPGGEFAQEVWSSSVVLPDIYSGAGRGSKASYSSVLSASYDLRSVGFQLLQMQPIAAHVSNLATLGAGRETRRSP